ncbi:hypothetical protein NMY22_g4970 [Coprinellus aureogranulatus]|nr:hypothetical protein NMY22_g4970 [Coprinellus aureogranulatus]
MSNKQTPSSTPRKMPGNWPEDPAAPSSSRTKPTPVALCAVCKAETSKHDWQQNIACQQRAKEIENARIREALANQRVLNAAMLEFMKVGALAAIGFTVANVLRSYVGINVPANTAATRDTIKVVCETVCVAAIAQGNEGVRANCIEDRCITERPRSLALKTSTKFELPSTGNEAVDLPVFNFEDAPYVELPRLNMQNVDLPCELWEEMASNADPIDVLSWSATCRGFHAIFSQRSLWLRLLNSVCNQYGIFKPTFPMDNMDLGQLMKAALRPGRWRKRIPYKFSTWPHAVSPWSASETPPRIRMRAEDYLVPGGRFFVTSSSGMNNPEIRLWDLGLPGIGDIRTPTTIATYSAKQDGRCIICHVCSTLNNRLTVLICVLGRTNEYTATVLRISPDDPHPRFTRLSTLNIEKVDFVVGRPSLRGVYAFFPCAQCLLLWDYEKNTAFQWALPSGLARAFPLHAYLSNAFLTVCSSQRGLMAWKFPPRDKMWSVTERVNLLDQRPTSESCGPDLVVPFPWASQPVQNVVMPRHPTATSTIPIDVRLTNNINLRYHVVSGSCGNHNERETLILRPISFGRFSDSLMKVCAPDPFGNGLCFLPGQQTVYAFRSQPYRSTNDPRFKTQEEFASEIYEVETMALPGPSGTSRMPVAVCMLSGRVLYGSVGPGQEVIATDCVDYLP